VNEHPAPAGPGAILLDIEGTTTPIAFVTRQLFPYVRTHLRSHLERHERSAAYEKLFASLRAEHAAAVRRAEAPPPWVEAPQSSRVSAIATCVEWLMDRDRKSPALKELQGRIWDDGYRRGELVGEIFPDVPGALRRWQERGVPVGIFSSGSVQAQQLLFGHSSAGDLSPLLRWFFDTQVGPKIDPDSYRTIARAMEISPGSILFVSDIAGELTAARAAGLQVRLSVRPGNAPLPERHDFEVTTSLAALADDP
jgi:2,3-diketo-5-methylthio-1-phosphopentane phosphatase